MNLKPYKILVTGADGFIGSHLCETLVNRDLDVRAFVYYNSFNSNGWLDQLDTNIQSRLEIISGDIRDPNAVNQAVKDCQVVFHLAALIGIPFSYVAPDSYIDTNVRGCVNVLQACRNNHVEKIIHTSTSEVYGSAISVPIDENHPLQGQSPYSASKIAADQFALSFFRSFATPVVVARPFNTYGPRQSRRAVIPSIITQLISGTSKLNLGLLSPTRDFNYVADTVSGFIAVAESDACVGEVINLGSGYEISIADTLNLIANIMSCKYEVQQDNQRIRPKKSEVERLCSNNKKVFELTNWTPKYHGKNGFRRGLTETIEWFKKHNGQPFSQNIDPLKYAI